MTNYISGQKLGISCLRTFFKRTVGHGKQLYKIINSIFKFSFQPLEKKSKTEITN